jgi:hypothetical protein
MMGLQNGANLSEERRAIPTSRRERKARYSVPRRHM